MRSRDVRFTDERCSLRERGIISKGDGEVVICRDRRPRLSEKGNTLKIGKIEALIYV